MLSDMFSWNLPIGSGEGDENVKSFYHNDDDDDDDNKNNNDDDEDNEDGHAQISRELSAQVS